MIKEIRNIKPTDGKTRIDLALELAERELFSKKGGVRMGNPKVHFVTCFLRGRKSISVDS